MVAHIRFFDETPAGARTEALTVQVDAEVITARELIRRRVAHEAAVRGIADPEPHVLHAWQAFERNSYFVLFDDRQLESLDDPVPLSGESEVAFIRLIPLVGG